MKNLFLLLFIPLFFFSCIEVEKEFEVGKELEVVIVEFGDLTSLSDDKQYGNFEIKVPEINDEVVLCLHILKEQQPKKDLKDGVSFLNTILYGKKLEIQHFLI